MSFYKHIRNIDNIIKNTRALTYPNLKFDFSQYTYKNVNLDLCFNPVTPPGEAYIWFHWNSVKTMYISLYDDYFDFRTYDSTRCKFSDEFFIDYNITRDLFKQLPFVIDMYTLEYKHIKYLESIKNQIKKGNNSTEWV